MKTQSDTKWRTTRTPPVITSLTLQKNDDHGFTVTAVHRRGRRTLSVSARTFRLDHDGRLPADVEVWLWGMVATPIIGLAEWEEAPLF